MNTEKMTEDEYFQRIKEDYDISMDRWKEIMEEEESLNSAREAVFLYDNEEPANSARAKSHVMEALKAWILSPIDELELYTYLTVRFNWNSSLETEIGEGA